MKNENYIVVQGWMINNLNLTGNDLLVYAIIFGFTQDGKSQYRGSSTYIEKALGISKSTARRILSKLVDCNLIIKKVETISSVNFNLYKVAHPIQNEQGGIVKMNTSNTISNSITSKEKKIEKKEKEILPVKELSKKQVALFDEWVLWRRKEKKRPMSFSAMVSLAKKMKSYTDEECEKVIRYSIDNDYQGLFWDRIKSTKSKNIENIDLDNIDYDEV